MKLKLNTHQALLEVLMKDMRDASPFPVFSLGQLKRQRLESCRPLPDLNLQFITGFPQARFCPYAIRDVMDEERDSRNLARRSKNWTDVCFHDASVPFVHENLKGAGLHRFTELRPPGLCQTMRQKGKDHMTHEILGGDPHSPAYRVICIQNNTISIQEHNGFDGAIEQGGEIRLACLQLLLDPSALGGVLQDARPEHIPIRQRSGNRIEMNPSHLAVPENAPIPVERFKGIHGGNVFGYEIRPVFRMNPFGNDLRIGFPLGLGHSQYLAEDITRHLDAVVRRQARDPLAVHPLPGGGDAQPVNSDGKRRDQVSIEITLECKTLRRLPGSTLYRERPSAVVAHNRLCFTRQCLSIFWDHGFTPLLCAYRKYRPWWSNQMARLDNDLSSSRAIQRQTAIDYIRC
ncbi:MAG: hypothetical protein WCS01_11865 [bacterium]